jgi:hypothetical protein
VKKLISIGVVLALLTLAVLPAAVAAYDEPETYAKIPFAIIGSLMYLLQDVLNGLTDAGLLPETFSWLPDLMPTVGDWITGPLGWTVDMMAWGLGGVGGTLMSELGPVLDGMGIDLGMDLAPVGILLNKLACSLFYPFASISPADWDPCG